MRGELLEKLAETSGLMISELKFNNPHFDIIPLLRTFLLEKYNLAQWNYTLAYLSDRPLSFTSMAQIEAFLD